MTDNIKQLETRQLGRCVFCGRPLSNSDSIERFAGPICFSRYGNFIEIDDILNIENKEAFEEAIKHSDIEIDISQDRIEISNQILRKLAWGLESQKAQAALEALVALGYPSLAYMAGAALEVYNFDGASLDKAFIKIEDVINFDKRITIKNGRVAKRHWSIFIQQIKDIPGRKWDGTNKKNHLPLWPQSAKAVLAVCQRWLPKAEIDEAIKELAKQPDIIIDEPKKITTAKIEKTKEGIDIYTPKYNSSFNDSLKTAVFGWNKGWNKEKRCWWVKNDFVEPALSVVLEYYPTAEFDKELLDLVEQVKKQNEFSTAVTISEEDEIHISSSTLYPFQSAGVRFLELKIDIEGGVIIGDDMGLGKTVQALAFIARKTYERTPTLITCPANIKTNWCRQVMTWINNDISCVIVEGGFFHPIDKNGNKIKEEKYKIEKLEVYCPDIVVVNYDLLKRHKIEFCIFKFQTFILDESHYVKEYKSGRSKAAREIAERIPRRILMTGNLILNRPREAWHQLHICDPQKWSKFTTFGYKYCNPEEKRIFSRHKKQYITIRKFDGASNLDELHRKVVGQYMIRRKKKDVLKEFPDKTVYRTTLDIEKKDRAEYDSALNNFIKWAHDNGGPEKVAKVNNAEAITKLTTLRRLCAKSKVKAITEYCNEWLDSNEDEQLVIFAHHREIINALEESIKKAGFSIATIRGGDSSTQRQDAIDKFVAKEARVFVASIQAAGTGTDGLQVCQNMKVLERTWRPADMVQAEDRLWRIKQEKHVTIEYLDMAESIDDHMASIIEEKMKIINQIVDGSANDAGDISGDVLKSILKEAR